MTTMSHDCGGHEHRPELPLHSRAKARLDDLLAGSERWAICWPCVHEYLATVTNPRKFRPATSVNQAMQVIHFLRDQSVQFLSEGEDHLDQLGLLLAQDVQGGAVHDARIAAICLSHGVSELWTADRDFARFPMLPSRNPLADAPG